MLSTVDGGVCGDDGDSGGRGGVHVIFRTFGGHCFNSEVS